MPATAATDYANFVSLEVDGLTFEGWKSVHVTQAINQGAIGFALVVTEKWHGRSAAWRIQPGAAARLMIDGTLVCTGHVDSLGIRIGESEHEIAVTGRSLAGDLIDSSTVVPGGNFQGASAIDIITAITKPFGISVHLSDVQDAPTRIANARFGKSGAASLKKQSKKLGPGKQRMGAFEVNQGEKAYESIQRLCKLSGLLVFSRADGDLEITRAGSDRYPFQLPPFKSADAKFDWSKRFSEYLCKGQQSDPHFGNAGAQAVVWTNADHLNYVKKAQAHLAPSASVTDTQVASYTSPSGKVTTRYRPMIVRPEGQTDHPATLARAQWQMARDFGEAINLKVTLQGFHAPDGSLWQVNRLIHVADDRLNLDHELLVASVTFMKDDSGTRTELELSPQGAYTPEPVDPSSASAAKGSKGSKGSKGTSQLWTK